MFKIHFIFALLNVHLILVAITVAQDVRPEDVEFYLYNQENPVTPVWLQTGYLNGVKLDNTRPFKFIVHGWIADANQSWIKEIKNEYLKKGEYNVIGLDWHRPANVSFCQAAENTKDVARYTGLFIIDLKTVLDVSYDLIHLIGHSLGAQLVGFTGKYLNSVNISIGRVTGLDPTGPCFFDTPPSGRIGPNDAKFVDIMHTDGNEAGNFVPSGTIDFYVNGGTSYQPGCLKRVLKDGCSHLKAFHYFNYTINSYGFIGNRCDSYFHYLLGLCKNNEEALMGENTNVSQSGIFHLTTNGDPPFARYGHI